MQSTIEELVGVTQLQVFSQDIDEQHEILEFEEASVSNLQPPQRLLAGTRTIALTRLLALLKQSTRLITLP